VVLKVPSNTVDLLGLTVDEATEEVENRASQARMQGNPALFLLHGHGTGRLKNGLRAWLSRQSKAMVKSWRPGAVGEGGDAFTVMYLQ
jgi:DNA mismatch repair protein MutS2